MTLRSPVNKIIIVSILLEILPQVDFCGFLGSIHFQQSSEPTWESKLIHNFLLDCSPRVFLNCFLFLKAF